MGSMNFFILVIVVQLFWSFGITVLAYSIPADQLPVINMFSSSSSAGALQTAGPKIQTNMQSQLSIPAIDAVTLIFYSGNLFIDLILNFFTAVPQMFGLLFSSFTLFFPINADMFGLMQYLFFIIICVIYMVGFLTTILNMRSGSQQVA